MGTASPASRAPPAVAPSPAASSGGDTENGWTFHAISELPPPPSFSGSQKSFPSGRNGGFLKKPSGVGGGRPSLPSKSLPTSGARPTPGGGGAPRPRPGPPGGRPGAPPPGGRPGAPPPRPERPPGGRNGRCPESPG